MALNRKEAKELLLRTLDSRGCCTDRDLATLPELSGQDIELLLEELVYYEEIIALQFHPDLDPQKIRTVFFPLGTCVYEPGLRLSKGLPILVLQGLKKLKEKGIVNDDMLENVPRQKVVDFHDALKAAVLEGRVLTAGEAVKILKKVMGTN